MMGASIDFSGQVVVVTGGSRGLGREMCEAFAAHGASVVVASRKESACEELAATLPGQHLGVGFHAGSWGDADRLVGTAVDHFGRIDVLVNNAGMSPLYPSLIDVSEELFDKVLAVNFRGPFRLCALVGTQMEASGGGSIINVSSTSAVQPMPTELVYAGAKAALNTLTVGLARAFGPHVRVNGIMPGLFGTDISKAWTPEWRSRMEERIPAGRVGRPAEIVGAALYLASDMSTYTNGAILKVDGGAAYSQG